MATSGAIENMRGYWNPKAFPNVAKFASLSQEAQERIIQVERIRGSFAAIPQFEHETREESMIDPTMFPNLNQGGSNAVTIPPTRGLPRNPIALTAEERIFIAQVERDVGMVESQILSGWLRTVVLDPTGIASTQRAQIRAIAKELKFPLHKDF